MALKTARRVQCRAGFTAAGAATGLIAPSRPGVPWLLGAIILALFIPAHVQLWAKFPIWYHLVFLVTLAPLVALGAVLTRRRNSPTEHAGKIAASIDRAPTL